MTDISPSPRLALITGASAGIGTSIARLYASKGFNLALVARREDRITKLAAELSAQFGMSAYAFACDLSVPDAPGEIMDMVENACGPVDILVNNAGYGIAKRYHETDWTDQAAFLQLMLTTPCEMTHRVLPGMRARGFGRIVNIASIAGLAPPASGHTLYAAVKAGLVRFSQSLNAENDGSGVHVTAVCPGMTYSEFHDVNGQRPKVSKLPGWMWQSAEAVALESWTASEANKAMHVTGRYNRLMWSAARLLPENMAFGIMKKRSAALGKDGR
ncbi:MAG: dehydrogenase [Hirschia sp.]|nr:dehydrogenase [Hirschia sp.]MBF17497.1 dehydrogenase [Hirschia sp.]